MDRIIFGDNQFFGVNHMSEERGMAQARRFQNDRDIIAVLDTAYDCGIRAFTFSTHDRVSNICDHFRIHRQRYRDLNLYPALPYAQKYAHAVAEKGIVGTIADVVFAGNTVANAVSTMARGGALLFNRDPLEIMKLLVDAEMKMFRDLNVKVVFLQNIVTDLLLGLGWKTVFTGFVAHVERRYGCRAGFITLNMPRLVDLLLDAGIDDPIVCSAINKVGFQMNPSIGAYEEALRTKPFQPLAMSILAAGALRPTEAIEYIGQCRGIRSVIFGASSKTHIAEVKELLETVM